MACCMLCVLQCAWCIVRCTLSIVYCGVCAKRQHCAMCVAHFALCAAHSIVRCALYRARCEPHVVHYAALSLVRCALRCARCALIVMCCVPCVLIILLHIMKRSALCTEEFCVVRCAVYAVSLPVARCTLRDLPSASSVFARYALCVLVCFSVMS